MPGFVKCLGVRLAGDLINDENERGEPIVGETLLLLLNGHWEPIRFTLPANQATATSGTGSSTRPTSCRGGPRSEREASIALQSVRSLALAGHPAAGRGEVQPVKPAGASRSTRRQSRVVPGTPPGPCPI